MTPASARGGRAARCHLQSLAGPGLLVPDAIRVRAMARIETYHRMIDSVFGGGTADEVEGSKVRSDDVGHEAELESMSDHLRLEGSASAAPQN